MKTRCAGFLRFIASIFAVVLLAVPSLGTAGTLTIKAIDVVVGGVHYCSDSVPASTCGGGTGNAIWFLGSPGVTLSLGQTLILTQSGLFGAQPRGGENFDTSDRGGGPDPLFTCSGPPNGENPGTPCTVQIYIDTGSGLQLVSNDTVPPNAGNNNPLSAGNDEPTSDATTAAAFLFNEALGWTSPGAGTFPFAGTNFTLDLGYADNIHAHACPNSAAGSPNPEDCFPQPVWCSSAGGTPTTNCPSGTFPPAGGFFIGAGRSGIGNCIDASNPNPQVPPPNGVAHQNKDASGNVVNCYDAGALRITANPPNITIQKTPKSGTFTVGSPITYTIVVSSDGPTGSVAHNVVVTDTLPGNGGLVWQTATTSPTANLCTSPIVGNALSCHLGDMPTGTSVTITVTSAATTPATCQDQPNGSLAAGGARATDNEGQSVRDFGDQTCTLHPHLKVMKTPDIVPPATNFAQGGAVSFTIVVSNDGDPGSVATSVALSDQLPTAGGLNWSGATVSPGLPAPPGCSISATSLLTCPNLGSINQGSAVTITVSLASTPPGACQFQNNPAANATADGGLTATDGGSLNCVPPPPPNLTTVTQGGWGAPAHGNNPGTVLNAYFASHPGYQPKIGDITNACGGKVDTFTSAAAIRAFLPAGGTPGVLSSSATNPTSTSAGVFAGQVLALTLNTQVLSSGSSLLSYVITTGPATGKTVGQVLADADKALGGCGLPSYVTSISQLNDVVDYINNLFD